MTLRDSRFTHSFFGLGLGLRRFRGDFDRDNDLEHAHETITTSLGLSVTYINYTIGRLSLGKHA